MFYLKGALDAFNAGLRPIDKKMKGRLEKLTKDEIDALINYYGSFE